MVGTHVFRNCRFEAGITNLNPNSMVNSRITVQDSFLSAEGELAAGLLAAALENTEIKVLHNEFQLAGYGTWGISIGDYMSPEQYPPHSLIEGNHITGSADAGILLWSGHGSQILNNDLGDLAAAISLILLAGPTSDCLVVGAPAATVLDLGSNNRIEAQNRK